MRWTATALAVATLAACSSGGSGGGGSEAHQSSSTTHSTETSPTTGPPGSDAGQTPPSDPAQAPPADAGQLPPGEWWRPSKGQSWQWQLVGEVDVTVDAEVFDVDLFETSAATVQALHDRGRKVICYFSAGSWEPYRPDSSAFPESIKGGTVDGWPDERWLDIRQLEVLRPLLVARLDLCAQKGFDGVEPDWLDSFQQDTGFPISAEQQLTFNRTLADLAHQRGLAIGLKNDVDQAAELADVFDFVVNEQCAEYGECERYAPFLDRGKPVFHAEYDLATSEFCGVSRRLGLSSIRKKLDLGAWRETC
jgi:hypothetical protein